MITSINPIIINIRVTMIKARGESVPGIPPTFTPKRPVIKLRGIKTVATTDRRNIVLYQNLR